MTRPTAPKAEATLTLAPALLYARRLGGRLWDLLDRTLPKPCVGPLATHASHGLWREASALASAGLPFVKLEPS
jgi:hypothetical protein